jgi:hypothetical protein
MIERAVRLAQTTSETTSVVLLVLFNLVPLAGVLLWGWSVATLLILYWVENGIVGLLNVPKILLAQGPDAPSNAGVRQDPTGAGPLSRAGQAGFFLVHYGIFWVVHGIFVFTLPLFIGTAGALGLPVDPGVSGTGFEALPGFPGPALDPLGRLGAEAAGRPGTDLSAVAWGGVGLAISHGASFVLNFLGRREYLRVGPATQMFAPYRRLMTLHLTIILGAMASLWLGSPVGAVVVLVVLKTAIDLTLHRREHGRLATVPAT